MQHSILCVDDEPDNVDALERLLRKKYRVFKATSAAQGLDILKQESISLIISDQRMPAMTGVEFLAASMKSHPESMRILLTGYTDIDSVIGAINSGQVYRYVTKPWDPVDLANTVDKAIEKFELSHELREKNIALSKALEELRTLDDAKNHFMILINHELKTPLTAILSYLELLHDTRLDEEQKKFLKRINEGADRLKNLVNDVLELVSAQSGTMKVNMAPTSTKRLLEGLDQEFIEDANKKSQKFEYSLDDVKVLADQKVIHSVIKRILDNAVKFGESNSAIRIESQKLGAHKARISITNQGKGLSPQAIEKILQPFQLDEDIMHHSKGTGLGLSVSQALLKTHNSNLSIECPSGQFKISFDLSVQG